MIADAEIAQPALRLTYLRAQWMNNDQGTHLTGEYPTNEQGSRKEVTQVGEQSSVHRAGQGREGGKDSQRATNTSICTLGPNLQSIKPPLKPSLKPNPHLQLPNVFHSARLTPPTPHPRSSHTSPNPTARNTLSLHEAMALLQCGSFEPGSEERPALPRACSHAHAHAPATSLRTQGAGGGPSFVPRRCVVWAPVACRKDCMVWDFCEMR